MQQRENCITVSSGTSSSGRHKGQPFIRFNAPEGDDRREIEGAIRGVVPDKSLCVEPDKSGIVFYIGNDDLMQKAIIAVFETPCNAAFRGGFGQWETFLSENDRKSLRGEL